MIRHPAARTALDCLDIASVIVGFIDLHALLPVLLSCHRLRDAGAPHIGTRPLPDQRPKALCIQRAADAVGYGHGV
jgi:hypothetical protein